MPPYPQVEAHKTSHQLNPRILILMPCGASKAPTARAAMDLYTGPLWQTLRTHGQDVLSRDNTDLWILSAEHGLIDATEQVAPYDRMMDVERVETLTPLVDAWVDSQATKPQAYGAVLYAGGHLYRGLMERAVRRLIAAKALTLGAMVVEVHGQIGEQRARLAAALKAIAGMPRWSSSQVVGVEISSLRETAMNRAMDSLVGYVPWRYASPYGNAGVITWASKCSSAKQRLHQRHTSELRRVGGELAVWEDRLTRAKAWEEKVLALREFPCAAYVMQVGAQMSLGNERKRSALQGLIRQVMEQIESMQLTDLMRASNLLRIKTQIPEVALARRAYFDPQGVKRALGMAIKRPGAGRS